MFAMDHDFLTWWRRFLTSAMFMALMAPISPAAEIRLREQVRIDAGVVLLGHVAEITGNTADVESLSKVELFPAPPAGAKRYLRVRELQDVLAVRQINLIEHRITGSSTVEVNNIPERKFERPTPIAPRPNLARAQQAVHTAVYNYVQQRAAQGEAYEVQLAIDEELARAVQKANFEVQVRGGTQPWVGTQQFEVIVPEGEPIGVAVEVTAADVVVVAIHSVARGSLVQAADVELRPLGTQRRIDHATARIADVVGREATQTLVAGQVVTTKVVRPPRLVQRGNPVTVIARSSGLRVRTTARAREDGSMGEVIPVESLLNRQSFFARVVGIDEVEVYARAVEARESTVNE